MVCNVSLMPDPYLMLAATCQTHFNKTFREIKYFKFMYHTYCSTIMSTKERRPGEIGVPIVIMVMTLMSSWLYVLRRQVHMRNRLGLTSCLFEDFILLNPPMFLASVVPRLPY